MNPTACPHCGAPFNGASVVGEYKCKSCGGVIVVEKDAAASSKPSDGFYQPDPPQSVDAYRESTEKATPPDTTLPNAIPQEVINKLDETRNFLGLARKWGIILLLGIIAFCTLCTFLAVSLFRTGK